MRGDATLFTVETHQAVGSTNDLAMAAAQDGRHRHWVVAREQLAGRGRSGRVWTSSPGNLYASLALCDPCDTRFAPQLGFVAGVALHQAVERATQDAGEQGHDLASRLGLKWPNDLLLAGAKLAGILVEGRSSAGSMLVVVIGMGVNLKTHPADTPYPATDLSEAGCDLSPDTLFSHLRQTMADAIALWDHGNGFAAIRTEWLKRAHGLGHNIVVRRPGGDVTGIFRDLDPTGRLLLDCGDDVIAVDAGDVFFETLKQRQWTEQGH